MAAVDWQLFLAVLLAVIQSATCYGYRNCIEVPLSKGKAFNCFKRPARLISDYVEYLPASVINLTISLTPVKSIPNSSFVTLTNLQSLQLSNNSIGQIDLYAFKGLFQLQNLNLSCNNISELKPAVFEELHNLTLLLLAGNKLKKLPERILFKLVNLKTLHLSHNLLDDFSNIAGSLSTLRNITTVDLCFNKLANLRHANFFLPNSLVSLYICRNNLNTLGCHANFLGAVRVLDLSYNSQLNNQAFSGLDLKPLKYLRIRNTDVNIVDFLNTTNIHVDSVDFTNTGIKNDSQLKKLCLALKSKVQNIRSLLLGNNGLGYPSNSSLYHCPPIEQTLDVSGNKIQDTKCLKFLDRHQQIHSFIAEHNYITKLQSCEKKGPVFYDMELMSFRYNRIIEVKYCSFCNVPRLRTLNLNINKIVTIDSEALKGLKWLQTLRLDNNFLADLGKTTFQDLVNLTVLNLRNNRISVIFEETFSKLENLVTLDLGGNKITHSSDKGFDGLRSLTHLYLNGNNLNDFKGTLNQAFFDTLGVLDLEGNKISFQSHKTYSPFVNLSKLQDLKMGRQRPHGLTYVPQGFFKGLHSLTSLYMNENQIIDISPDVFDDLTSLKFLTLSACCTVDVQLKQGTFKNLRNLSKLIIENTGMEYLSQKVFGNLTNLSVLQINRNGIKSIEVTTLESLTNLQYLDVRNVPLSCTCKNSLLQNWTLNNTQVQVVDLYSLPCQNDEKHKFSNFDTKVCFKDIGMHLFLYTFVAIVLFTLTPLLYVKLYWKIKFGLYVLRSWISEQWRRIREEEENCKYDAFISYNSSDEHWVMNHLLPNLEGNGSSFKLCLHHRDFELGRDIVDNIVTAVYSSRKTICVVSKSFLQSEWCLLEIQLASYRLFDEHRDVLLPVFLEPISERQMSSYHRMRKVMLKKTYLQWPGSDCTNPDEAQNLFWTKLRRAMKTGRQLMAEESDDNPSLGREENDNFEYSL